MRSLRPATSTDANWGPSASRATKVRVDALIPAAETSDIKVKVEKKNDHRPYPLTPKLRARMTCSPSAKPKVSPLVANAHAVSFVAFSTNRLLEA
jgi:hypothetical protein